ncbi:MAG: 8-amino-7-oxononanoate synthase [Candidatus Omnitrophota bacterium]|nr:8-amino-7-oxononanoate synthase [Candidatus Omnitrophota bacterium]
MFENLQKELDDLEARGLRRICRQVEAVEGARIRMDGRWLLHFSSNGYLGLARHPAVVAAAEEAAARYGTGSGSARLIGGNLPPHEELERELARFKQAEDCLLFSTGYMASLGIITALTGPEDLVVGDRLNHASLIDACRLSGAALRVYPHSDADRLEEVLKERRGRYRRAMVVTEGVFSMDGDLPPLPRIAEITRRHDAWLLVDDAHGTGVFGEQGRGSLEHFGMETKEILQMGTLSKALGSQGGYLAGPRAAVELLRNRARSFIYTTAPAPACSAAALAALQVVRREPDLRRRLWENVRRWTSGLEGLGWDLISKTSPIVPVRVGGNRETMALAKALEEAGLYAPAIRPPTVPEGSARIRTSLTSLHTAGDLEEALGAFKKCLQTS